ncbi:zinc finger protein 423 [Aphis craccivora]|uniref:Zinc finger protein 423 n=1 Tax=Aphis craccivora TaxID=307492 RepID=A0A6G0Y9N1_APHCR|nr:zinc finger protein 423 [Aphis craccivora]
MFNCETCEKVFSLKCNLVRHVKTHERTTNTCGICLKTYTRKYNLNTHVQIHHKIAPNTPEFQQDAVRITGATEVRDSVIRWAPPATPPPPPPHADPSPAPITNCRTDDTSTPLQAATSYERASVICRAHAPTTTDTAAAAAAIFDGPGPSSHCCARCVNQVTECNIDWPALVCSVQGDLVPKSPEYTTLLSRLETFGSHPLRSCQVRYSLAECGFAYTGTGDTVRCFYCGLSLSDWEENDEAWLQHAVHNPKCVYVLLCKGVQFIENAKNAIHKRKPTRTRNVDG